MTLLSQTLLIAVASNKFGYRAWQMSGNPGWMLSGFTWLFLSDSLGRPPALHLVRKQLLMRIYSIWKLKK